MRGTGSLRALLGQDTYKRRQQRNSNHSSTAAEQRTQDANVSPAGSDSSTVQGVRPGAGPRTTAAPAAAAAAAAQPTPAPPAADACGVQCPVCSAQLPLENSAINAHLGELEGFCSSSATFSIPTDVL